MHTVFCDCNCKYSENGECQEDSIVINLMGECDSYVEPKQNLPLLTDLFYALCKNKDNGEMYWREARGIKVNLMGREMFNVYGSVTDGRTGCLMGNIEVISKFTQEKINFFVNKFQDMELDIGLSPLYTNEIKLPVTQI